MDRTKDALLARIQKSPLSPPTRGAGLIDNAALLSLFMNKPQIIGAKGLPDKPQNTAPVIPMSQLTGAARFHDQFKPSMAPHEKGFGAFSDHLTTSFPFPANEHTNIQSILDALTLPKNKSDAQKFYEALMLQQLNKDR